jgi:hypothetical protein
MKRQQPSLDAGYQKETRTGATQNSKKQRLNPAESRMDAEHGAHNHEEATADDQLIV